MRKLLIAALVGLTALTEGHAALALDKIRVATFQSSSALPYYVAVTRGYFTEFGLDPQEIPFASAPLIVQAMVTGDIDAASNLVAMDALNMDALRPKTVYFVSLNGQNAQYATEEFIVRPGYKADSLKDLKGARIFSVPGPGNVGAAKGVLAAVGLQDNKDYTMQEQPLGVQIGALRAGTFDAGYTLEPVASMMVAQGVGRRLETGVIATYLLGNKNTLAITAGAAVSGKLLADKPDVAARFAKAWAKAVKDSNDDPSVRDLLTKYMAVDASVAPSVTLVKFGMASDMTPDNILSFQKYADLGVTWGVVRNKIDVNEAIKKY